MEATVRTRENRVYDLVVHPEKCCGCYTCQVRCSLRLTRVPAPSQSAILVQRAPNTLGSEISFTERCDMCTICALYCPYGALERVRRAAPAA